MTRWNGSVPEPYVEPATPLEMSLTYLAVILFSLLFWVLLIGGVMWAGGWFR